MFFAAFTLCAAALSAQIEAPARPVAIRADKVWLGDGRVLENATVLLKNGRIEAVGTKVDVPAGIETIEHKGTLTAGLIALHGATGEASATRDDARPALPEGKVALAFDPDHYEFEDARNAGVTSLVITPAIEGVCSGSSAVVKSAGHKMLSDEAQLSLVFTAAGLSFNREPTSLGGAVAMLDQMFAKPTGAVERAVQGKLPCLFEATTRQDVQRVLEFAKRHALTGAIHGVGLAGEMAEEIKESKLAVIVPVLSIGEERRNLRAVGALAKAGIVFGFGLDSPWNHPAQMRLGVAMCVREGLDPQAAWTALTSNAARIAGVADRVGRIDRGLDADIVLWSGDPLDLGSQVTAVYVDGARVFGAKP